MTIPLELYATILLLMRIVSMTYIFLVLKRQYGLFRLPIKDENKYDVKALRHFRAVLFFLALIIFLGNITPFIIDILALIPVDIGRPKVVTSISFVYTLSASLTSLVSSHLIWRLYRLAAGEKEPAKTKLKTKEK